MKTIKPDILLSKKYYLQKCLITAKKGQATCPYLTVHIQQSVIYKYDSGMHYSIDEDVKVFTMIFSLKTLERKKQREIP